MNQTHDIVDRDLLAAFFHIDLIEQGNGRILLRLSRHKHEMNRQPGSLACIFDFAARLAGYKILGQCFISECEINVQNPSITDSLFVNASIVANRRYYATYHCEIYSQGHPSNTLLAESQGTLKKMHAELSLVI